MTAQHQLDECSEFLEQNAVKIFYAPKSQLVGLGPLGPG